jgi:hypothetical protein
MNDEFFPSGPWTGFYNYSGPRGRHRMDLHLTFANGRISGDGSDDIGRFAITGKYDAATHDCHWVKQYLGQHAVHYEGGGEQRGIWGIWKLMGWRGGFHIWPLTSGAGETTSQTEEMTTPAQPAFQPQPLVVK